MARYHINASGEAGRCKAAKERCPFGGQDEHYASEAEARQAYEQTQPSSFATMDHTPRSNWIPTSEKLEESVYTHYRRHVKSARKTNYRSHANKLKQAALKSTADHYGMPVAQVKSIAQQGEERAGIEKQHDPRYLKNLAFKQKAEAMEAEALRDASGELMCGCGSTEIVRARPEPAALKAEGKFEPLVSCFRCYFELKENV